ncbi:hypothetical protein BCR42DRAFT_408916 [Absidia repens]|uniref:RING-type domain-containing protein n=1 Tax=Absidia repens TaxID=90262 RepID=A0A1X2IQE8_9FUNG|nr:hypothetical protein BCR42DRAFT_408916 [Absidia repens]
MGALHSRRADISEDPLDFGPLAPQERTTTTSRDYDAKVVKRFIREGRLAPFYQGHYEKPDNHTNSQLDLLTSASHGFINSTTSSRDNDSNNTNNNVRNSSMLAMAAHRMSLFLACHIPENVQNYVLYKETVECPICFLFYPPFINHTRCCDKLICTECFVQLKRSVESPSLAIHCPFCMQPHLGVIRVPPSWSLHYVSFCKRQSDFLRDLQLGKRKRLDIFDPDVVLVDHVRPEWQEHLGSSMGNTSSTGSTRRAVVRPLQIPAASTNVTPPDAISYISSSSVTSSADGNNTRSNPASSLQG